MNTAQHPRGLGRQTLTLLTLIAWRVAFPRCGEGNGAAVMVLWWRFDYEAVLWMLLMVFPGIVPKRMVSRSAKIAVSSQGWELTKGLLDHKINHCNQILREDNKRMIVE